MEDTVTTIPYRYIRNEAFQWFATMESCFHHKVILKDEDKVQFAYGYLDEEMQVYIVQWFGGFASIGLGDWESFKEALVYQFGSYKEVCDWLGFQAEEEDHVLGKEQVFDHVSVKDYDEIEEGELIQVKEEHEIAVELTPSHNDNTKANIDDNVQLDIVKFHKEEIRQQQVSVSDSYSYLLSYKESMGVEVKTRKEIYECQYDIVNGRDNAQEVFGKMSNRHTLQEKMKQKPSLALKSWRFKFKNKVSQTRRRCGPSSKCFWVNGYETYKKKKLKCWKFKFKNKALQKEDQGRGKSKVGINLAMEVMFPDVNYTKSLSLQNKDKDLQIFRMKQGVKQWYQTVVTLKEVMGSFFNAVQGFLLCFHGSSVGDGPTLPSIIHIPVIGSSLRMLHGFVSLYEGLYEKNLRPSIPQHSKVFWETGSIFKQVLAAHVMTIGNALFVEEMEVTQTVYELVSETVMVIKDLIRVFTWINKFGNPKDNCRFGDSLEKLLKFCNGTIVHIDIMEMLRFLPKSGMFKFKSKIGGVAGSDAENNGMVAVIDIVCRAVLSQFKAYMTPISALCFDPSGTLLVTASLCGNNINDFQIMPPPSRSALGDVGYKCESSHVHLYKLHRVTDAATAASIKVFVPSHVVAAIFHKFITLDLQQNSQYNSLEHILVYTLKAWYSDDNILYVATSGKEHTLCEHSLSQLVMEIHRMKQKKVPKTWWYKYKVEQDMEGVLGQGFTRTLRTRFSQGGRFVTGTELKEKEAPESTYLSHVFNPHWFNSIKECIRC